MPFDCAIAERLYQSNAAVRCPNDDCGPHVQTVTAYGYDGRALGSSSSIKLPGEPGWDGSLDGRYRRGEVRQGDFSIWWGGGIFNRVAGGVGGSEAGVFGFASFFAPQGQPQSPRQQQNNSDCMTYSDLLNDPVIKEYAEKLWNRTLESKHENGFILIYEPAANKFYLELLSEGRTLRAGKTQYAPEREAMPEAGPETDRHLSNYRRAGHKVMLLAIFHTHPNLWNGESRSDISGEDRQFVSDYSGSFGILRHGDGYTFFGGFFGKPFRPSDAKANDCIRFNPSAVR